VYGKVKELLPKDAPEPLGSYVTSSHYIDANLMHNITSGKSVTGILHLVNKTPIDWYSKRQATVETVTYGSEFVAARVCVEQIIDLCTTLRYLGVPVRDKSYMFGDNKSVVDSSMKLHAKLHKDVIISLQKRSNCIWYPWIFLHTRRNQPFRHPKQTLGIFPNQGAPKITIILER
jgi:hypothetical protein